MWREGGACYERLRNLSEYNQIDCDASVPSCPLATRINSFMALVQSEAAFFLIARKTLIVQGMNARW